MKRGDHYGVVGLGKTGVSCTRFLLSQGVRVSIMEENLENAALPQFQQEPNVSLYHQAFTPAQLQGMTGVIVSPGVPLTKPMFDDCRQQQIPLIGDIDLFAQHFPGKIIAITGSNGKSTVTAWVGEILRAAGKETVVAGNIGSPVMESLPSHAEYAVLELSSYQLELTEIIAPAVATILNITPDHLDRYPSYAAYVAAKQRIFNRCKIAVVNGKDAQTIPQDTQMRQCVFNKHPPAGGEYGLLQEGSQRFLAKGTEKLMPVTELTMSGEHNVENALAAFALTDQLGIAWPAIRKGLATFSGLPHRCQWVRTLNDVQYINDSKGTNVGATLAALEGIGHGLQGKVVLIAGGQGKGADFCSLQSAVANYCRAVFVFGEAKQVITEALKSTVPVQIVEDLAQAVQHAQRAAQPHDVVLLSPACASLDMFNNFMHRGDVYTQLVKELSA